MSSIGLIIAAVVVVIIFGAAAAYIHFNATSQIGNLQTILSKYDINGASSQLK